MPLSPIMRLRLYFASLGAVMLTIIVSAQSYAASSIVPQAACYPSNDLLAGPFKKPLTDLTGALGGLLQGLFIIMVVLLALLAIVTILTKNSSGYIQKIGFVVGIFLGLSVIIMIVNVVKVAVQNSC